MQVDSCEECNPDAEIPFDWILRAFADAKDYVDYILPAPGLCPKCRAEIHEKTLVQPTGRTQEPSGQNNRNMPVQFPAITFLGELSKFKIVQNGEPLHVQSYVVHMVSAFLTSTLHQSMSGNATHACQPSHGKRKSIRNCGGSAWTWAGVNLKAYTISDLTHDCNP
jgi:hypothetical protein